MEIRNAIGPSHDAGRTPPFHVFNQLVLDGVDTVGKSTLAEHLRRVGYTVVHSPFRSHYPCIVSHYRQLLESNTLLTVFDRSFITEIVYGPVVRGYSRIPDQEIEGLARFINLNGAVIYLYEDMPTIISRLLGSTAAFPKHKITLNHLEKLLERFDEVMKILAGMCPVYCVKSSSINYQKLPESLFLKS